MKNEYAPIKQESDLKGGAWQTVFWQQSEEVGEPALIVRTYDRLIEISQEGRYININAGTVDELCRTLKAYAAHSIAALNAE
jgi:hypothetical protein